MEPKVYNVGGLELARPFKTRRLGHFGFYHEKNAEAVAFYRDNFGLRVTDSAAKPGGPPMVVFTTHGADHHSVVHIDSNLAREVFAEPYARGVTFNQISFQVGSLQEVVDAYQYCMANAIKVMGVGRDFPGSNWALYFYGPNEHTVELFYGMEQIGWQRESKPPEAYLRGPIFANPHDVPELPQPAEAQELRALESSKAGNGTRVGCDLPYDYAIGGVRSQLPFAINKVGPLSFFVDDVSASQSFYVDRVGLQLSEEVIWEGHRCVFLRTGTEHHTIALFPMALRERLGFDPRTQLMSMGLELGNYQQLKDARDLLSKRGLELIDDIPPQLRPGIDYAFYVRDPSGHAVMLYYYMEQIGWDGRPRPADQRRRISSEWPETLPALSDTYMEQSIQGPIG
ncbi:MAG: VOC family protein [Pseudomonadota bacterium]|nr:VOC family protein [Pseudomonadota bacterium]